MPLRYLFGPVPARFVDQNLCEACASRTCIPFAPCASDGVGVALGPADNWESLGARFPEGWRPDLIVLQVAYQTLPEWLFTAPVPLVGLAVDAPLQWHYFRRVLRRCEAVLADLPTVERLRAAGIRHARPAHLFGLERAFLDPPAEVLPRDIDCLFLGNLHPAVQLERLAWLGRLARLRPRWNVVLGTNLPRLAYRDQLRRSKIAFNRSARGEANMRAFEAVASGALLFQEASNREVPALFRDGQECVLYDASNLEERLEHYLSHEDERRALVKAAQKRIRSYTYAALWQQALDGLEADLPALRERAQERAALPPREALLERTWQALGASFGTDPTLATDLLNATASAPRDADLHNALGLALAVLGQAGGPTTAPLAQTIGVRFQQALTADPHHLVAALNLVEAAVSVQQNQLAVEVARRPLRELDRQEPPRSAPTDAAALAGLDAGHFPPGYDPLRVAWERAAWDHAGDPASEAQAKRRLLRWRLHNLLAELTDDLVHYYEAVAARPDLPPSRVALGCVLGRTKHPAEAVVHLRAAVEANPFDRVAARALYQALLDAGEPAAARRVAAERRLLLQAAPAVVPAEPWFAEETSAAGGLRLQTLDREEFARRFGAPDTARALCGFTSAPDTQGVLTLLAHARPQRILEIGTALGHMTANLAEWSPDDAVVFSLGTVAGEPATGSPQQAAEAPTRADFGRLAGHFGKGHKVFLTTADSLHYDFSRLAPLDFAFIDGAHDLAHVLSDTRKVYEVLRPGGCLVWHDFNSPIAWVEVRQALEQAGLPETIYHIEGTQVAFLHKTTANADARPAPTRAAAPPPASPPPQAPRRSVRVVWEGSQTGLHSLALVNRALCARLAALGHEVSLLPLEFAPEVGVPELPVPSELARLFRRPLSGPAEVHVRHRWPPDFRPPASGHWVTIQPWEFGSLPCAWAQPVIEQVDEVWAYTSHVRDCYVESGVPAERVRVVPLGVDTQTFRPGVPLLPLQTGKRFKFLFVGGTLWRKGFDILLAAYARAFSAADDVCLVIKEMGKGTFYRGQTGEDHLAGLRERPSAPEVEYIERPLSAEELAGLYAACNCLALPYRGEGFALPVAEAMACGLSVIVTGMGAALDYCNEGNAYLVPARRVYLAHKRIGDLETTDHPWLAEPDLDALVDRLRYVAASPADARVRAEAGCAHIRGHFTWDHAAAVADRGLRALCQRPVQRSTVRGSPVVLSAARASDSARPAARQRVCLCMIVKNEEKNLYDCVAPVLDLFDHIIINDTGSTDRTKEIARSFGPKVKLIESSWPDSFAAARNVCLEHASGDWIFWLDADDRVDEVNHEKLRSLFTSLSNENVAFSMKCFCVPDPHNPAGTFVDHIRLFRNHPHIRWEYRVHEQILPAVRRLGGEARMADVVITHVGYQDPALRARKLQRDLALLEKNLADTPEEPFCLFNLGSILQEQGKHAEAIPVLRRSLAKSGRGDSIVRKLHALIASCHRTLEQFPEALKVYAEGKAVCPGDAELLYSEARLLLDLGNFRAAEASCLELLASRPEAHFASVIPGLREFRGRELLGKIYERQERHQEALAQWRLITESWPFYLPGWLGLAENALLRADGESLEQAAGRVESFPGCALEAALLRARGLIGRGDFAQARARLEALATEHPRAIGPRWLLSLVCLQDGSPPETIEQALREVLRLDPAHAGALHNLSVQLRQRTRTDDAFFEAKGNLMAWVLGRRYEDACLEPSALNHQLPTLCELARDCPHVTEVSTHEAVRLALLRAQPKKLVCYDLLRSAEGEQLQAMAGETECVFHQVDGWQADLEETDLLVLDARRGPEQLAEGLRRQAARVRRYIVLHGPATSATNGNGAVGPAVEAFLAEGTFRLRQRLENNKGLTVLERVSR